ncbi:hypothetical protein VaNZ11_007696 [Volvox africanus]|uniref:Uncharacterized protein n=1 Tax=Volvox africanus TaxID=51714 RepID=A0ABQ5S4R2_9CHLO|nr:hypothetical protein VaNZ11_007696 [Volvox africanus]
MSNMSSKRPEMTRGRRLYMQGSKQTSHNCSPLCPHRLHLVLRESVRLREVSRTAPLRSGCLLPPSHHLHQVLNGLELVAPLAILELHGPVHQQTQVPSPRPCSGNKAPIQCDRHAEDARHQRFSHSTSQGATTMLSLFDAGVHDLVKESASPKRSSSIKSLVSEATNPEHKPRNNQTCDTSSVPCAWRRMNSSVAVRSSRCVGLNFALSKIYVTSHTMRGAIPEFRNHEYRSHCFRNSWFHDKDAPKGQSHTATQIIGWQMDARWKQGR